MSRYAANEEERIRTSELVREWTRSGLLSAAQRTSIDAGLRTDLRRTNRSLRAVLFIFGTIVVWASCVFFLLAFGVNDSSAAAWWAMAWGVVCFVIAEFLVSQFRLYRFGVEEAFAIWSVALLAVGTGILTSIGRSRGDFPLFVSLLTATMASTAVYLRFGYLYSGIAAPVCAAAAPFFLGRSEIEARLLSVLVLSVVFIAAQALRRPYGEDFPGDDYGVVQSVAWLGIYALLNLRLSFDLRSFFYPGRGQYPAAIYWGTYAVIWLLPAAGLYVGLRSKHRVLIWASLVMAVATLVTNKPYLGWERHAWDPILLGVLLTGAAIAIRQWLSRGRDGQRYGFTPKSILGADRESLAILSTVAGGAQPFAARVPAATPSPSAFEPGGGGRSGGGGGSAGF
jgi:hypothetical protein